MHFSPFGCVEKSDANPLVEARVIHDLSCPIRASTNAWSVLEGIPELAYDLVDIIARRIIALRRANPSGTVKLMKGDVKAAYKNLYVHEEVSAFFAGSIPEDNVVVIGLALPFGWTGSAAHYGAFGKAISHLVRRESPNSLNPSDSDTDQFFCFDWVDDHVLVEHDIGDHLQACDSAIRLAMTAVLGPRAINEKKFTDWSTRLVALGLEWDSVAMTVSMPQAKIQKALGRVQGILNSTTTTRTQLSKLLGSLRHVGLCIRPAKPFFQRLVGLWKRAPRAQPARVSQEARLDLVWFDHILRHGRLTGVSLEYFCDLPAPDVHLYMDASDTGLCVLNPAQQEYLRIQFDATEKDMIKRQEFSINVREQFSAFLAVLCWGGRWRTEQIVHVRFWIDNSTAVTWCNKLASTNPLSQEMNRIFGAVEAEWSIRVSAGHLVGSSNFLADMGSRAWSNPLLAQWLRLTNSWTQVQVPINVRKAYYGNWSPFSSVPSPTHLVDSTTPPGSSGQCSATESDDHRGCPHTTKSRSLSSLVLFAIDRWTSSPATNQAAISSIHTRISHVKWFHRIYAGFEPEITPDHATAFAGMRRLSPAPSSRTPVSPAMLEWIANHIDYKNPQQRLFLGAALLGFIYLLRSSQYLAIKGGSHKYALEVRDVQVCDIAGRPAVTIESASYAVITLRGSKTDQQGLGTSRSLTRSGHDRVCPVLGTALLLELAERNDLQPADPVCSFSRTRMLRAEDLSKVLKAAARGVGMNPQHISCHSLRSGGASSLIASGADSTTIKLHGGWKSNTLRTTQATWENR